MQRYITDEDTFRVLSEYYHHRTDIQRMELSEAISRVPTADVVEKERFDRLLENSTIIAEALNKYQTADVVERKKGKWERHYSRPNVFADLYWHCSVCGYKNDNQWANVYHLYCPNCGADMRKETEDDND